VPGLQNLRIKINGSIILPGSFRKHITKALAAGINVARAACSARRVKRGHNIFREMIT
jgi:hypothetical protein